MREDEGALDKRKAYILATVVYEYVATAEPVGSQTLTQKYNLGVSSATVRNEMAELEAGGYLVQPHTSAGRIPSDAGYRTYVDHLMQPEQIGVQERRRIRDELRDASHELDEIIDHTTRLLGRLSNNLAFVTKPQQDAQTFKHIQLIWLSPRTGVAIVVTSLGVAAQSLFELGAELRPDDLTRFSNALNARFANRPLRDVVEHEIALSAQEAGASEELRSAVVGALQSARSGEQPTIAAAGAQNLLDQPEFQDLRKLRSILRIIEEQKTLYDIVADAMNVDSASVKIGHELGSEELADLSIVTVPYRFGPNALGMLSILGPRRMPYARLLALASGTAETLSERLSDVENFPNASMPTKDYYDILGVARDASGEEIKRAYRGLARTHHPDVSHDKSEAEHRFKEINEAYEVLSDPTKRAQYDRFGAVGNGATMGPGDFGFGPAGFGDIFDMFFGGARGGMNARHAGPQRGSDLRYDLEITLEEAFAGVTKEITFNHLAQCDVCKGSGATPGTLVVPCNRCGGSGIMRVVRQTPLGQIVTQTTCTQCGGEGHVIESPCQACHGRGRRELERKLTVKVPPGVDDGSRVRITRNGEAGTHGGPPGDLYVYLGIAPHPIFKRDGLDTFVDVPISFPQATLGSTISVPSLEGDLELTLTPGTQPGTMLRLRGHGMPSVRGTQRGDHHVTVHVMVPTKLNKHQRDLLEEYAHAGGDAIDERTFFDRVKEAFRPE